MNARTTIVRALARGLIDADDVEWMRAAPHSRDLERIRARVFRGVDLLSIENLPRSINEDLAARLARAFLRRDVVLSRIDALRLASDVRALDWITDRIAARVPGARTFADDSPDFLSVPFDTRGRR